jgi:lipopolysaccharide biosynthesis glycosyltransferase
MEMDSVIKNAIIFGFTNNHVGAVATVVMDAVRLSGKSINEFVFLHDGLIRPTDQKLLSEIAPSRFLTYDAAQFMDISPSARCVKHFTSMVFSKFECIRLLSDYDTVTWLDYDIVVRRDISPLFEPCSSGLKILPGKAEVRKQFYADIADYDMSAAGICGSTFTFDRNFRRPADALEFCYRSTSKHLDLLHLGEQGIIDLMIQEFDVNPVWLDHATYTSHPSNYPDHARIIHAYGRPKFWEGLQNDQWQHNYDAWIRRGGSPIPDKSTPPAKIEKSKQGLVSRVRRTWSKYR